MSDFIEDSKRAMSMPKNAHGTQGGLGNLNSPARPKRTSLKLTGFEKHGCLDDKHDKGRASDKMKSERSRTKSTKSRKSVFGGNKNMGATLNSGMARMSIAGLA